MKLNRYVLSDVHLEKLTEVKINFLLKTLNEKVEYNKSKNESTLFFFAGDLHNYDQGLEFLSKIKTNVVYIPGNHEFWRADYYETIEKLKKQKYKNIKFLYNDCVIIDNNLIIGTTLWTDVGNSLNKDVFSEASLKMNDTVYIEAKKWYQNAEKTQKLYELYPEHIAKNYIDNKLWNSLIEIEENNKSINYLNSFNDVLDILSYILEIENKFSTSNDFIKIEQEDKDYILGKIDKTKNITWKALINNIFDISSEIKNKNKSYWLKNDYQKNKIFQQLKKEENILNKDIIVMSHHLPFYEEILIGNIDNKNKKTKLYNEKINHALFLIRNGRDYPEQDYLERAISGEIDRVDDITHIVNYYNNGSETICKEFIEKVTVWIHGHEHHFKYKDYLKGMQLVTNPCGSALFFLDENLKLKDTYFSYNGLDKSNVKEIELFKENFFTEIISKENKDEIRDKTKYWILKNFDWDKHISLLKKIEEYTKDVLINAVEYLNEKEGNIYITDIENKINYALSALNYICKEVNKNIKDVELAFNVRTNPNFNFQNYYTSSLKVEEDVSTLIFGNSSKPEEISIGIIGLFSAKKSFENKAKTKISLRYAEKTRDYFKNKKHKFIYEITKEDIEEFKVLEKNNLPYEKVLEKIEEKWNFFYTSARQSNALKNNF